MPGITFLSTGASVGKPRSSMGEDASGCAATGVPATHNAANTKKAGNIREKSLMTQLASYRMS